MTHALQQMMKRQLTQHGWSYSDVARRGGIPRSTVHHLATTTGITRMPQPATLQGLARGLRLPLEAIRHAAAQSCGIHLTTQPPTGHDRDPEVDLLIASLHQLTPTDRHHVAVLVASLLHPTTHKQSDPHTHHDTQDNPEGGDHADHT